ncbi:MAG: hypothetical protein ACK4PR_01625 [Gammaproteobacteria bacterium]
MTGILTIINEHNNPNLIQEMVIKELCQTSFNLAELLSFAANKEKKLWVNFFTKLKKQIGEEVTNLYILLQKWTLNNTDKTIFERLQQAIQENSAKEIWPLMLSYPIDENRNTLLHFAVQNKCVIFYKAAFINYHTLFNCNKFLAMPIATLLLHYIDALSQKMNSVDNPTSLTSTLFALFHIFKHIKTAIDDETIANFAASYPQIIKSHEQYSFLIEVDELTNLFEALHISSSAEQTEDLQTVINNENSSLWPEAVNTLTLNDEISAVHILSLYLPVAECARTGTEMRQMCTNVVTDKVPDQIELSVRFPVLNKKITNTMSFHRGISDDFFFSNEKRNATTAMFNRIPRQKEDVITCSKPQSMVHNRFTDSSLASQFGQFTKPILQEKIKELKKELSQLEAKIVAGLNERQKYSEGLDFSDNFFDDILLANEYQCKFPK